LTSKLPTIVANLERTGRMISNRQQAYLDAIGIEVWSLRDAPPAPVVAETIAPPSSVVTQTVAEPAFGLKLGSGSGGILLICGEDVDSASRLANDICRALGSPPVWAWPDDEADAVTLPIAVENNLYTTVAIFGNELAGKLFGEEIPTSLNAANLVLLPSMEDIQSRSDARKSLWAAICRSGMVSKN
jgi:DNA polymerase III psi subunit